MCTCETVFYFGCIYSKIILLTKIIIALQDVLTLGSQLISVKLRQPIKKMSGIFIFIRES